MPKTIDEQLAKLDRDEKAINGSLARVEKQRNELHASLRKIREQRERLELTRLEGQAIALQAGASRHLANHFCIAAAKGMTLVKVNRKQAIVEADGKTWRVPFDFLQDPAAGLMAGMIL